MSPVEDLIDDPVGQSCRLGIRRLGERLCELDGGRTQLMDDAMSMGKPVETAAIEAALTILLATIG